MGARASFLPKTSQKTCLQKSPTPSRLPSLLVEPPCLIFLFLSRRVVVNRTFQVLSMFLLSRLKKKIPARFLAKNHPWNTPKKSDRQKKIQKNQKIKRTRKKQSRISMDENQFQARKARKKKRKKSPKHKKNIFKTNKKKKKNQKKTQQKTERRTRNLPVQSQPLVSCVCEKPSIPTILSKCALSQPNSAVAIDFGRSPRPWKSLMTIHFWWNFNIESTRAFAVFAHAPSPEATPVGSKFLARKAAFFSQLYLRTLEKSKKNSKNTRNEEKNIQNSEKISEKNKKHKERKTSWNHRKKSEQELIDAQKKSKKDQKKPKKTWKITKNINGGKSRSSIHHTFWGSQIVSPHTQPGRKNKKNK